MPQYNPRIHHRRSIRLPKFDYSSPGSYFLTVCTQHRDCVLSTIDAGELELTAAGQAAAAEMCRIAARLGVVEIDASVMMPNHVHAIVSIVDRPATPDGSGPHEFGDRDSDSIGERGTQVRVPTLGEFVRAWKAASTRAIRLDHDRAFAWQRNYYEHVIRSEREFLAYHDYIQGNPARWSEDDLYQPVEGRLS